MSIKVTALHCMFSFLIACGFYTQSEEKGLDQLYLEVRSGNMHKRTRPIDSLPIWAQQATSLKILLNCFCSVEFFLCVLNFFLT